jgi:HYR domain/PA14 domain/Secretion system C-terminal sorting domain
MKFVNLDLCSHLTVFTEVQFLSHLDLQPQTHTIHLMSFLSNPFRKTALVLSVFFCCLLSTQAWAQTTVYQGPALGNWFDASNWSAGLPVAGGEALILGGGSVLINQNLSTNYTISSFGTITVASGVTATFNNTVSTPELINNGSIVNNQSLTAQNSFTNAGTVLNTGQLSSQGPTTNAGTMTNEGTLSMFGTMTNSGAFVNKNTTTNSAAWANGSSSAFTVLPGGTFNNDFGSSFTWPTGLTANIQGNFFNTGTLAVNGLWDVTGVTRNSITANFSASSSLLVKPNGQYQNFGTTNLNGPVTVSALGILSVAAFSTVNNNATFNNLGTVDITGLLNNATTGTVNNLAGSSMNGQFGSTIKNSNVFVNTGTINSNGMIENAAGTLTNNGMIQAGLGSVLTNNADYDNTGTLSHSNQINNNGTMTNTGTVLIQSGGLFQNAGILTNAITGTITSQFDLVNLTSGTLTNNGKINVDVRLTNNGSMVNNAYVVVSGRLTNAGTLKNYELIDLVSGAAVNTGTIQNFNRIKISVCSEVQNRVGAVVSNVGEIRNSGIVFQKGTVSGNALVNLNGYVHTSATSGAPICAPFVIGLTNQGEAKAYATSFVSTIAIDSCANFIYLANGVDKILLTCTSVGTTPVSLVVKTPTGDSLTCSTTVTFVDNLAPSFVNCPSNQTVQTTGTTAVATWVAPTVVDNCTATPTLTVSPASGSSFNVGITGVTYTTTDAAGNVNLCQFKVTVQQVPGTSNCTNNTVPTINACPSNITVTQTVPNSNTTASWIAPTASDVCYPLSLTSNFHPGAIFSVGATTVTYKAVDGGGLTKTCSFTVTVNAVNPCTSDTKKPVVSGCPANIFLPANVNTNTAVATWNAPNFQDACPITVNSNFNSGAILPLGITTLNYIATDASGNSAVCNFKVTVGADPCPGDVSGPVFAGCPGTINLVATTLNVTASWTAPTATDNCGGATINSNYAPGSSFPVGTTMVSYTASDAKGNLSTCTFNVIVTNACVNDIVKPVITGCPASIATATAPPATTTVATWALPTATDNCSAVSLTSTILSGSAFPIGSTTITYLATDLSGNTATCTFFVSVTAGVSATCVGNLVNNGGFETGTNFAWWATSATPTNTTSNSGSWSSAVCGTNGGASTEYPILPGQTATFSLFSKVSGASWSGMGIRFYNAQGTLLAPAQINLPTGSTFANSTMSAVAPSDATKVGIWYWMTGTSTSSCLYVDDVCLTVSGGSNPTCSSSTIPSNGFESGNGNWWFSGGAGIANTNVNTGANAAYACGPSNGGAVMIPVTPGQLVKWQGYAKVSGTPTWAGLGVDFYDVNSNWVGSTSQTCWSSSYKLHTGSGIAPANAVKANIYYWVNNGCIYADDFCFTTGNNQSCSISVAVGNASCNNNGTSSNPADDTYTFVVTVNSSCTGSWSGGGKTGSFGVPVTYGPYLITSGNQAFGIQTSNGQNGNVAVIAPAACSVAPSCAGTLGTMTREKWHNLATSLTDWNAIYANAPSGTYTEYQYYGPSNITDNYASRMRGFIRPTTSGNYTFLITGDDNAELWLNSGGTSQSGKTKICSITGWTTENEFYKYASQTSVSIWLNAHTDYYIEMRQREWGGGDHFNVRWKTPTNGSFVTIPGANLKPWTCAYNAQLAAQTMALEATQTQGAVQLQWAANNGTKNDVFLIERMNLNNGEFEIIGHKSATKSDDNAYMFSLTDDQPLVGENRYRVRLMQNDGTEIISDEQIVIATDVDGVAVFPNPARSELFVSLNRYMDQTVSLSLTDAMGRAVHTETIEQVASETHQVSVEALPEGTYFMLIRVDGYQDVIRPVLIRR